MKNIKLRRVTAFIMAFVMMLMSFNVVIVQAASAYSVPPVVTLDNSTTTDGKFRFSVVPNYAITSYITYVVTDLNWREISRVKTQLGGDQTAVETFECTIPQGEYGQYQLSVTITNEGLANNAANVRKWPYRYDDQNNFTVCYLSPTVEATVTKAGIREYKDEGVNWTSYVDQGEVSKDADDIYLLNRNGDYYYAFYAEATQYDLMQAVFLSEGGTVLKTEDMTWDNTNKRYTTAIYKADNVPDAAKVEFRTTRDPSKKISIDMARLGIGSVGNIKVTTTADQYQYLCFGTSIERYFAGGIQDNEMAYITGSYSGKVLYMGSERTNSFERAGRPVFTVDGLEIIDDSAGGWDNDMWSTPAKYYYAPPGTTVTVSFDASYSSKTVAALVYKNKDRKEVTIEKECSGTADFVVPDDAMQLLYTEYRTYNERGELSNIQKGDNFVNYYCSNFIEFTDVPDVVCQGRLNINGYRHGFQNGDMSKGNYVLSLTDSTGKTVRTYLANTKRYKFTSDQTWNVHPNYSAKLSNGIYSASIGIRLNGSQNESRVPIEEMGGYDTRACKRRMYI